MKECKCDTCNDRIFYEVWQETVNCPTCRSTHELKPKKGKFERLKGVVSEAKEYFENVTLSATEVAQLGNLYKLNQKYQDQLLTGDYLKMGLWSKNEETGYKYIDAKNYRFEARYLTEYDRHQVFILNKNTRKPISWLVLPVDANLEDQNTLDKAFDKLIAHVKRASYLNGGQILHGRYSKDDHT